MNTQDAEKIVTEKSNDELLAMLAYPNDWQPQILDAAKAMLQRRGVEFSTAILQAHQAEATSGKHKSEATANTSLILGIIGAFLMFIGVISREFDFSFAPAGILGGFLGLIAFFLGIIAVFRKGSKSRAVTGIVTGGLAALPFLLPLLPLSHHKQTQSSLIHYAAESGNLEEVKALINGNPDLVFSKSTHFEGMTPLHLAAEWGNKDVAELLLAKKADVNAKDDNGQTPLHVASAQGQKDVVELLLANKADVNVKDNHGNTPLSLAFNNDHMDVAEELRQHGGHDFGVEIQDSAQNGDLETVKALLKDYPDLVFNRDNHGFTPLHRAASMGHKEVAELLLAKKADVNAMDNDGQTPLHVASAQGQKDVVELLLANKADVNAKDHNGDTPLHMAAVKGDKDVVELLLINHADVNAKDDFGEMPAHTATISGHKDVAEYLRQHGGHDFGFEILDSAQRGDLEKVKALLKDHPNLISSIDDQSHTPLHEAASMGHKDVVEWLLANHADVNAKDDDGQTPLHVASAQGHKDVVELLLANKADVNAKDDTGLTPLHYAAQNGHKDVAELLLANKADVNAKDHNGDTPLHMAASFASELFGRTNDVAELLRQHGGQE